MDLSGSEGDVLPTKLTYGI